jgi:hypothetical protein
VYKYCFIACLFFSVTASSLFAQQKDTLYSFTIFKDVKITIDRTVQLFTSKKPALLILYALPNGNTTAQTMGKKMAAGDDWHFDIQHIRAQTAFLREVLHHKNIVVAYLENDYKSWPAWKQKHPEFAVEIKNIVDTLSSLFTKPVIYLNGHSGGGSFIFGYLKSVTVIPDKIRRISFIDSNYGYDSTYSSQLIKWLNNKHHSLNVFAYNDSVALYNDKPVVSATGGTWYKSHLLLKHLSQKLRVTTETNDSLVIVKSKDERVQFFFKLNPYRKIFHTQQVELNGFIHSVLSGTKLDSKNYQYYGQRAYTAFIKD